jgi:two-component system phosphate regulon response regulator PhoB
MNVPERASPRPFVLVVEDERDILRVVATALEEAGFDTVAVRDGAIALEQCQSRDPAVIVLDLAMPELDGAQFAREYRKLPRSNARILVMSATPRAAEMSAVIRADAYISKPFPIARLVAAVTSLLRGYPST